LVSLGEVIIEIELLYREACEAKSIKLQINYAEFLLNYKIRTDRGRIM